MKLHLKFTIFVSFICYFSGISFAALAAPTFLTAIRAGDIGSVQGFIDAGHDLNQPLENGMIPLYFAVLEDKPEIVELLLNVPGINAHADRDAKSALMHAVINENVQMVNIILSHPETFNLDRTDNHGMTALHYACRGRNVEIIAALLDAGARKNIMNVREQTAFDYVDDELALELAQFELNKAPILK